jgi:hypothetical protein
MKPWLLIAGGAGVGLALWKLLGSSADDVVAAADIAESESEDDSVNSMADLSGTAATAAAPYADLIDAAAAAAGVAVELLVAIGWNESRWGRALKPQGAAGTGDWTARPYPPAPGHTDWSHTRSTVIVDGPTARSMGFSLGGGGSSAQYVVPADGLGWGRGLMQIDFGNAAGVNWADPATSIQNAADRLAKSQSELASKYPNLSDDDLLAATIAAYNAGTGSAAKNTGASGAVNRALQAGTPVLAAVDAVTFTKHYVTETLGVMATLTA